MYERQRIVQLHRDGNCTAAIALRLGLEIEYVRQVLTKQAAHDALESLRPERQRQARRARAVSKRAKALRLLAEAESEMGNIEI
ncbi:hypothetical protein [Mycobacterium avium]|jgi:hypothetical protein|uniref:hypothetical protein n=1 Tax=Mycobacterium avium TaxID=1764 RepID=UPI0003FC3319|nr:hypothetical protein [Mycobacterium avium]KBR64459.1 hypothetical protein X425_01088 [Mycobacterium avium XTB13-223]MCA4757485.1 hypothetical protein [Mycobacterium avium subsp. hominissuis]MDV3272014.1 hypothetical protein [Mycobacterium avium]